jgi:hypothetical protein
MSGGFVLIPILFVVIVIAAAIYNYIAAEKRRQALYEMARRLGLRFSAGEDYAIPDHYAFLDHLNQGENHYHYETHSTDSKGNRTTSDYYLSFLILLLPVDFPKLKISREGLLSKIAQAFGYDDIDFESAEFSRVFCVRSPDKKFAYDVCNASMIEYLLANCDMSIEIERNALALLFKKRLAVERVEFDLQRLLEIRLRLPEYLFTKV